MAHALKTTLIAAGLAAASLALAGSAQAKPHAGQACFPANSLENFAAVGRDTLNIRVNLHDYYQLKLLGACTDLPYANTIGLETHGSSFICSGLDATVIVPSTAGGPPQRCMATVLRKMSREEIQSLPPKQRP